MTASPNINRRREIYLRYIAEPTLEYDLQKELSKYVQKYYPRVEFRVDMAGNNLSKAAAGKNKAVNKRRGWPDFEIYDPSGEWYGLCLELKPAGKKIRRDKDARKRLKLSNGRLENFRRLKGHYWDAHIQEQGEQCRRLRDRGRLAGFAVGLHNALAAVDYYLEGDAKINEVLEF